MFPNDYAQLQKLEHIPGVTTFTYGGFVIQSHCQIKFFGVCWDFFQRQFTKILQLAPPCLSYVHLLHAESCRIDE